MIDVTKAESIILAQARLMDEEMVSFSKAYGRILREKIICDRDQPPLNKSTMDGVAVSHQSFTEGLRKFPIQGIIAAGSSPRAVLHKESCFKIMTGAAVPVGADAIIPIEYVNIENNNAIVRKLNRIDLNWNIRLKGSDCAKGTILSKSGQILSAVSIATAASVGKVKLKVSRKPKVAIISTGDELVAVEKSSIKPYQARMSNSYALQASIHSSGLGESRIFHLKDNPKEMLTSIRKILQSFDVLILSGGVSKGDYDYVPEILEKLKVQKLFHQVAQKPGKPFWFGKNAKGNVVFALPGNPVSTLVCCYRYVLPFLKKCSGQSVVTESVAINHSINGNEELTLFPVVRKINNSDGRLLVEMVKSGGSGDFASLAQADGFVELQRGRTVFPKDSLVSFYPWI